MKRLAAISSRIKPIRGYIAPCSSCGLLVVHADSTNEPFHMHARSKLCAELARRNREAVSK